MKTIILLVSNLDGFIDSKTVKMINYRNANNKNLTNHVPFDETEDSTTYRILKERYEGYVPVKGAGSTKKKNGVSFWYLPFYEAEGMPKPKEEDAVIMSKEEFKAIEWDVEEIEI